MSHSLSSLLKIQLSIRTFLFLSIFVVFLRVLIKDIFLTPHSPSPIIIGWWSGYRTIPGVRLVSCFHSLRLSFKFRTRLCSYISSSFWSFGFQFWDYRSPILPTWRFSSDSAQSCFLSTYYLQYLIWPRLVDIDSTSFASMTLWASINDLIDLILFSL